jgi:hypothetical protein
MAMLAATDLADGESVVIEGVLVFSLVVANCWLACNVIGWLLAVVARRAPAVDTVMMRWVVPHLCTFELVRKSRARNVAVGGPSGVRSCGPRAGSHDPPVIAPSKSQSPKAITRVSSSSRERYR